MSKLFYIQLYILLFHFVVNKEKLYIKYNEKKWEFTLNNDSQAGPAFYQFLKNNNGVYSETMYRGSNYYFYTNVATPFSFNSKVSVNPVIAGTIIAFDKIYVFVSGMKESFPNSEKIGQVNQSDDFANSLNGITNSIKLEFILEKEEERIEKPKNLETLKNMKILKRVIKMKPLYSWKNIGVKLLKSLKILS